MGKRKTVSLLLESLLREENSKAFAGIAIKEEKRFTAFAGIATGPGTRGVPLGAGFLLPEKRLAIDR